MTNPSVLDLAEITPLVLTFNEAANIQRTLDQLGWAHQILVIDSFSTDATCDIARQSRNVRLLQRCFDNHTNQWNFGLEHIQTQWVLSLDADYVIPRTLVMELEVLRPTSVAFFARFRYCIFGRPLRASLYPARAVLFKKASCRYSDDGHTQLLMVNGPTAFLKSTIDHDDRKPLRHWLNAQDKYACIEAGHLLRRLPAELNLPDRIRRKIWIAPWIVFFHTLFGKRVILDGWPGFYYALQRMLFETLLSLRLIELKLQRNESKDQRQRPLTSDL